MIDILGYLAGCLVVASLLPQIAKSWRTKSTRDISLIRYIIYVLGLVLWISYAIAIQNLPVAVMNGIGLILATSILYLKIKQGQCLSIYKSTVPAFYTFGIFNGGNFFQQSKLSLLHFFSSSIFHVFLSIILLITLLIQLIQQMVNHSIIMKVRRDQILTGCLVQGN